MEVGWATGASYAKGAGAVVVESTGIIEAATDRRGRKEGKEIGEQQAIMVDTEKGEGGEPAVQLLSDAVVNEEADLEI